MLPHKGETPMLPVPRVARLPGYVRAVMRMP